MFVIKLAKTTLISINFSVYFFLYTRAESAVLATHKKPYFMWRPSLKVPAFPVFQVYRLLHETFDKECPIVFRMKAYVRDFSIGPGSRYSDSLPACQRKRVQPPSLQDRHRQDTPCPWCREDSNFSPLAVSEKHICLLSIISDIFVIPPFFCEAYQIINHQ